MSLIIFDIQYCYFVDGPGIRTTVFFKPFEFAIHNISKEKKWRL
jgi:hypothetical protein